MTCLISFRLKSDSVQHLPVSKQIPMLRVLCCQCEDMDFKGLKRQTSLRSMSPFCTDLKGSEVFDRQSAAARRLQRQESVPANRLVSQLDLIWDFDASATTNRYPQASIIYDLFSKLSCHSGTYWATQCIKARNMWMVQHVDDLQISTL